MKGEDTDSCSEEESEKELQVPECSICSEAYDTKIRVPIVLWCGHTLCKECLDKLLVNKNIECPFDK